MKQQFFHLIVLGSLALPAIPLYAQSADEKPQTSVYDQHPECMNPGPAAAANAKCIIDNGPPRRHVVGADAAAAAGAPPIGGTVLTAPPAAASGQNSGKAH